MIRERYRSRVMLQPSQRIEVTYVDGPFRCLDSHWTFDPVAASAERPVGGTMLTFHIEFEFRSKLLQSLMAALFEEAAGRMVTAFKGRAKQLYGARRLRVPASPAAAVASIERLSLPPHSSGRDPPHGPQIYGCLGCSMRRGRRARAGGGS